ncbi:MAG: ROK family protein [Dehalococcoidia bacterium]|nr:ROK family protein [Dehalococcoidia bacterium]
MAGKAPPVIAVDLGGSKILSAVVDHRGKILASDLHRTHAEKGADFVIGNILKSVRAVADKSTIPEQNIAAIGLGAPGISNPQTGIVYSSPNLPDWQNVPLKDAIENGSGKKVFLINDANAAALGEMRYGAARGCRNFIYITLSTGIGGGIIIDGQLYTGSAGMAGEIGHIVVEPDGPKCNCGGAGCWELYASGTAMARRAREEIRKGKISALLDMAGKDVDNIDALLIQRAAEHGDPLAKRVIAETARYIGIGLGGLINIFNPELIVIGGGLANMGSMLLAPAYKEAARRSYREAYRATRFAVAELGAHSGVLGAAVYAIEQLRKKRS